MSLQALEKTKKNDDYRWIMGYFPCFLLISSVLGLILRVLNVEDMEYKEDEEYNFIQSQIVGTTAPWPWYGIPSGVFLVNPGMSVWVFALLAKLFHLRTPPSLAHGVQVFAWIGMLLIVPLVYLQKKMPSSEKRIWYWSLCLAMVNPFLVFYQRKLWPEPFLPAFSLSMMMGWFARQKKSGAFFWGLTGAWIGQVHMSGFFLAGGLALWSALSPLPFFTKYFIHLENQKKIRWDFWFLGSVLGALPLIPWLSYVIHHPVHGHISAGFQEMIQLKYWVFWLSDPLGIHLGNPLGLLRGSTHWDQLSDFVRYPLIGNQPTYLTGLAHLVLVCVVFAIVFRALPEKLKDTFAFRRKKTSIVRSETYFLTHSGWFACGLLMTLTGVVIRRYYMPVTFPLEFIFWVALANPSSLAGKKLLSLLWICELTISSQFVHYIHENHGSIQGDYGQAYHLSLKRPPPTSASQPSAELSPK